MLQSVQQVVRQIRNNWLLLRWVTVCRQANHPGI